MTVAAIELVAVDDAATREAARYLIAEYLRWIASAAAASYGLSFDIDAMVASDIEDRAKFYPPSGRFYVIRREDANVGVGCLKRITPSVAEIQRMYVQPHARGVGAGRLLLCGFRKFWRADSGNSGHLRRWVWSGRIVKSEVLRSV